MVKEMRKISKEERNWLSFAISGIGLVFTVIGVLVGIVPLILGTYVQYGVFVTSIVIEALILVLGFQGIITFKMFVNTRNEGNDKQSLSTKSITILLSILNLFFLQLTDLLFYAGQIIPIIGQLLFIAPFITIVAGIIFSDYKETHGVSKRSILYVLGIVLLAIIFSFLIDFLALLPFSLFSLLFGFIGFTIALFLLVYIIVLLELVIFIPAYIVSFFLINWDDRSQLLRKSYRICLASAILSVLVGNLITLFEFGPNLLLSLVFSVIFSLIIKSVYLKRIPLGQIRELSKLEQGKILLEINDLKVYYPLVGGLLKRQFGAVKAVDGVDLVIKTGETLGLVGESGCGKSTLAKAILGLVDIEEGEIEFNEIIISKDEYSKFLRQKIQIVFQDPDASLNPRMKVVDIISEPLKNLLGITKKKELRKHVLRLLEEVSLKKEHLDRYPHEFSGGQKQRIIIARALACNPELIILDEPTSALDVSVQAQILNLLKDLQRTYGYGFLFITHNLSVVNHIADQVAVMYLGRIVELGTKKQIFAKPTHPYTQALLMSRIRVDPDSKDIKFVIDGEVPSPIAPPPGCHFNPRCVSDARTKECEFEAPHQMKIEEGHYIWCVNPPVLKDISE